MKDSASKIAFDLAREEGHFGHCRPDHRCVACRARKLLAPKEPAPRGKASLKHIAGIQKMLKKPLASLNPMPRPRKNTPCQSGSDGECNWAHCPQEKDNRAKYQVICPLYKHPEEA